MIMIHLAAHRTVGRTVDRTVSAGARTEEGMGDMESRTEPRDVGESGVKSNTGQLKQWA